MIRRPGSTKIGFEKTGVAQARLSCLADWPKARLMDVTGRKHSLFLKKLSTLAVTVPLWLIYGNKRDCFNAARVGFSLASKNLKRRWISSQTIKKC